MRILIVTNHFYPENFRVNDIALHLKNQGHNITVLTAIPDYPQGKYYSGYNIFKKRRENWEGIKIIRSFIIPRGKGGSIRLSFNYLSLTISTIINSFLLGLIHRYDCIFVHETSPIMVGIPAIVVKKMQKIPIHFWVLDLWPESLSAAGGIHNQIVLSIFENLTKWIYRLSDKILISSKGFRQSIIEKGCFEKKIIYFPNWGEDYYLNSEDKTCIKLPEGFRIMFAGNIGEAQNFENIMEVANRLKHTNVKWIFLGDGRKREWIEHYINEHELTNNVLLLGYHPANEMPTYFKMADAMLVSLKDEGIFHLTLPAKIQAYMASAKPILGMIDGEAANIIKEANCGYVCHSTDCDTMENIIISKVLPNIDNFKLHGQNGFNYFMQNFSKEACMNKLEKILNNS